MYAFESLVMTDEAVCANRRWAEHRPGTRSGSPRSLRIPNLNLAFQIIMKVHLAKLKDILYLTIL